MGQAGLEGDAILQSGNYEAVQTLGQQLCQLRPDRARGWLLRSLAIQQAGDEPAHAVSVLQEGIDACQGTAEADRLMVAMQRLVGKSAATHRIEFQSEPNDGMPEFRGEWDAEGVFVYQAYCDEIADWALENQRFGGPHF